MSGSKAIKLIAICDSDECRVEGSEGTIKKVAKTVDWCPDCEAALFWKRITDGEVNPQQ